MCAGKEPSLIQKNDAGSQERAGNFAQINEHGGQPSEVTFLLRRQGRRGNCTRGAFSSYSYFISFKSGNYELLNSGSIKVV